LVEVLDALDAADAEDLSARLVDVRNRLRVAS
jgi:hypothetical protein